VLAQAAPDAGVSGHFSRDSEQAIMHSNARKSTKNARFIGSKLAVDPNGSHSNSCACTRLTAVKVYNQAESPPDCHPFFFWKLQQTSSGGWRAMIEPSLRLAPAVCASLDHGIESVFLRNSGYAAHFGLRLKKAVNFSPVCLPSSSTTNTSPNACGVRPSSARTKRDLPSGETGGYVRHWADS
jgi:hypothetical protein